MAVANAADNARKDREWPGPDTTRVPYWIYTDPDIYARELERFFYGPAWAYVGLSCEVPNPGDFKRYWIGERSVIVVRADDGTVSVLENVCAHRGSQVVWEARGNSKTITCPYHQWCYSLKGELLGLPFRRGALGKGGMPADFALSDHRMRQLRSVERHGTIWATFSEDGPPFEVYCDKMLARIDRFFEGRKIKLLGYQRQMLRCNWKMYVENLKDPYHATLLHTFYITFGLWRADNRTELYNVAGGKHSIMVSENTGKKTSGATSEIKRFGHQLTLEDMSLVTPIREFQDGRIGGGSMHPGLVLQHQANSLAIRHAIPKGVDATELIWTFYGYEDDTEEMTLRRIKHANLVGPSGLVSIDDSEILKQCQAAADGYPGRSAVLEMGGRDAEDTDHMVSETLIRGFYQYYRDAMGM